MLLLKLALNFQDLIEKSQTVLKIQSKCRLNFQEIEYFHQVECSLSVLLKPLFGTSFGKRVPPVVTPPKNYWVVNIIYKAANLVDFQQKMVWMFYYLEKKIKKSLSIRKKSSVWEQHLWPEIYDLTNAKAQKWNILFQIFQEVQIYENIFRTNCNV